MQTAITEFFKFNSIATICCMTDEAEPYCFNCFYAFEENHYLLFFKSSDNSLHSKLLLKNNKVAGTVLPVKIILPSIKGLQFSGRVIHDFSPFQIRPDIFYHKVHPVAITRAGKVWCIQLEKIKMTDNTRLFGGKTHWDRNLKS